MRSRIIFLLFISMYLYTDTFAAGVTNNIVGLQKTGMCSYVGVADDSTSVFNNPGGLTNIASGKLDTELSGTYNTLKFTYTDTAGEKHKSDEPVILPALFAATSIGNFGFGGGIYCPLGSGSLKYEDIPGGYFGNYNMKGSAGYYALGLSGAYKILPNLSIGLTIEAYYGKTTLKTYNYFSLGAQTNQETSGFAGFGAQLGIYGKVSEPLSFGLVIKPPSKLETKGTFEMTGMPDADIKDKQTIPWYFMAGVGYKVFQNFEASFDIGYRLWSQYEDKVSIDGYQAISDAQTVKKDTLKDNYILGGGVKYGIIKELDIMAGIMYAPTAKKDKYVKVGENDFDQAIFSLSMAFKGIQGLELHLGGGYIKSFGERDVPPANGDGKVGYNTIFIQGGFRGIF